MDRVKIIKSFDKPLRFSVSAVDKGARLYMSVVDSLADDVIFHVEFDKEAGQISMKDRYSGVWSKPQLEEFAFKGGTIKGKLSLKGETFVLELKDLTLEFPCKKLQKPILWNIYSDFRYITIGDDEPVTTSPSRRWRFFPEHALRTGIGPRLRPLQSPEEKLGLTALYLWNGDEKSLRKLVGNVHTIVDEFLIVVHSTRMLKHAFFVSLQSEFFNVRTVIIDSLMVKGNGDVEKVYGSLFINKIISEVKSRNVILTDSTTDIDGFRAVVSNHRLRSRSDDFIIFDARKPTSVQAFSIGRFTHFVESDGRLRLAPEDLAHRHPIVAEPMTSGARLEWNIGEMEIRDHPVTVLDRQRKLKVARRGKLAILVVSCKRNRHKQQAIRDTWAKDTHLANIDLCFVEGHPEYSSPLLFEDRLLVPAPDTYEYLSHKIWHMVSAALQIFKADHYLKLDDDCLVNIQKLLEFPYEDFEYVGSDVNLGSRTAFDWHRTAVFNKQLGELFFEIDPDQTWFDGQGGYFLSRKAAEIMAASPLAEYQHMLEDYATGRLMSRNGLDALALNSKFLSIRDIYIKDDRDYESAVISDVGSVERTFEIYEIISKLNQKTLEAKGRWRFDFSPEAAK